MVFKKNTLDAPKSILHIKAVKHINTVAFWTLYKYCDGTVFTNSCF